MMSSRLFKSPFLLLSSWSNKVEETIEFFLGDLVVLDATTLWGGFLILLLNYWNWNSWLMLNDCFALAPRSLVSSPIFGDAAPLRPCRVSPFTWRAFTSAFWARKSLSSYFYLYSPSISSYTFDPIMMAGFCANIETWLCKLLAKVCRAPMSAVCW